MTPISRLIPQTSGSNTPHRSERESMREHVGGPAMTPPIRPEPSGDAHGDDIVSEILRDTEGPPPEQSQNHHPSQYQEQEYPEEAYSPPPDRVFVLMMKNLLLPLPLAHEHQRKKRWRLNLIILD